MGGNGLIAGLDDFESVHRRHVSKETCRDGGNGAGSRFDGRGAAILA